MISFFEHETIFLSVVKWVLLATGIGVLVGAMAAGFVQLIHLTTQLGQQWEYTYLLLPLGLMLSLFLVRWLAPDAQGHGTEKVIEAVHKRSGRIKLRVIPVKLVTTLITLGVGGSVGKEGPSAQIGAGLASAFSDLFKFNDAHRRILVICGISAGFSAIFGTPISGAIIGVEILIIGIISYEVLLPSFVAGIVSYLVCTQLGMDYVHYDLKLQAVNNEFFLLITMGSALFFALVAALLIETLRATEKFQRSLKSNVYLQAGLVGLFLAGLSYLLGPQYLGLGMGYIDQTLSGDPAMGYDFLLKILFTVLTLTFGGSGGIVTPILFIGATAGSFFGYLFGLDQALFASIGLVCVLSGAANTPIAASIMAIELFGVELAPYAAVGCVISFLFTGHRSVYPTQILKLAKSPDVSVRRGVEINSIENVYVPPSHRRPFVHLRRVARKYVPGYERHEQQRRSQQQRQCQENEQDCHGL